MHTFDLATQRRTEALNSLRITPSAEVLFADAEKTAKAIGDSVYLMKHITCPGVLVECGFLSNSDEAQLLRQPEQQKRLAAAIVAGYLNFGNH